MKRFLVLLALLPSLAFGQSAAFNLSQLAHNLASGGLVQLDLSVTGTLPCSNGGTGTASAPANGSLLIGNGTCWTIGTLTAGANITITNNAGSITIASNGGGSMTWPSAAGIPCYSGSSSWCTSYSATNALPANDLPAALSSSTSINGVTIPATSSTADTSPTTTTANQCNLSTTTAGLGQWGSCSGVTLQTNGTNNSSQTALNIENGPGIAVTNPSSGNAQVAVNTPNRTVSGTSDTILSTDNYGIVEYTSSSAVAVTLPQATGSFASGFGVTLQNNGSNIVTVTPTTSVINFGGTSGLTALPLAPNTACSFWSDGANWNAIDCRSLGLLSVTLTSATSITPSDCYATNVETASATGTFTVNLPTGCTPYEGQRLLVRIISPSGGTVTYSANAGYITGTTTGAWPSTSGAASKMDDFQLIYTGAPGTTGWILEAYNQGIP